ncbi:predicted protein [Nematostella vectensis]|uniref:Ionotropic glutamate receptor L-glutamate and glycine-binding domain-containing protein n=1 Tax=Nematostella vectensis TaxID=45351 RepID=A7SUL0_NEMVE|nr:predicted protein [Nematostella vectensis]|eukprot:XP_001624725.1 predicted protein [Nematostella vectensis]
MVKSKSLAILFYHICAHGWLSYAAVPPTAYIAFFSEEKDQQSRAAVQSAINQVNSDTGLLASTTLRLVEGTENTTSLAYAANLTSHGALAILTDSQPSPSLDLLSAMLAVPLVTTQPIAANSTLSKRGISLAPSCDDVLKAIADIVKHYKWSSLLVLSDVRWSEQARRLHSLLPSDIEKADVNIVLDYPGKLYEETKSVLNKLNNKLVEAIILLCDAKYVSVVMDGVHSPSSRVVERSHNWILADMIRHLMDVLQRPFNYQSIQCSKCYLLPIAAIMVKSKSLAILFYHICAHGWLSYAAVPPTAYIAFFSEEKDQQSRAAVQSAINQVNSDTGLLASTTLRLVEGTENTTSLAYAANLTSHGALAILTDSQPSPSLDLLSAMLAVPMVTTQPIAANSTLSKRGISLAPSRDDVLKAIADIVKHYKWSSLLVLSDALDWLRSVVIEDGGELIDYLISRQTDTFFISLQLPSFNMVVEKSQIVVGLTPSISANQHTTRLTSDLSTNETTTKNSSYFLYDSVLTFAHALDDVIKSGRWVSYSPVHNVEKSKNAITVLDTMKKIKVVGTTGQIHFSSEGERGGEMLDVMNLRSSRFIKVGTWNSTRLVSGSLEPDTNQDHVVIPLQYLNRKLKVVLVEDPPFVFSEVKDGTRHYTGYSIDLITKIAELLSFKFYIVESPDGKYGGRNPDGSFNGIVVELQRQAVQVE